MPQGDSTGTDTGTVLDATVTSLLKWGFEIKHFLTGREGFSLRPVPLLYRMFLHDVIQTHQSWRGEADETNKGIVESPKRFSEIARMPCQAQANKGKTNIYLEKPVRSSFGETKI